MGWSVDLLDGVAQTLTDDGVGVWRPEGPTYADDETVIVVGAMPPSPDNVICLNIYPVDDHRSRDVVTYGVQVRTRGGRDPRTVLNLDDAVFNALDGLAAVTFGDCTVSQMYRRSSTTIGRDGQEREERTSTYYVDASRPSGAREF